MMTAVIQFIVAHPIELAAALVNFIWVYLEYKASVWLWPVGIVLPLFYIYLSIEAQFYGNVLINVYYLITSIIGWVMWLRHREGTEEGAIVSISLRVLWISLAAATVAFLPMFYVLSHYTDSLVPWADTLATVISFVGMIWLARRIRQHWVCWFVANIISLSLFYKSGDHITTVVFAVNTVMSVLGYFRWRKMQRQATISIDL